MPTWWYLKKQGEETGPVVFAELVEMVRAGEVRRDDRVRGKYRTEWQWADSVPVIAVPAGLEESEKSEKI